MRLALLLRLAGSSYQDKGQRQELRQLQEESKTGLKEETREGQCRAEGSAAEEEVHICSHTSGLKGTAGG